VTASSHELGSGRTNRLGLLALKMEPEIERPPLNILYVPGNNGGLNAQITIADREAEMGSDDRLSSRNVRPQMGGEGEAKRPSCSQKAHDETVLVRCAQYRAPLAAPPILRDWYRRYHT